MSAQLAAVLVFHITAGSFALAAGATALLVRKGAWLHRTAGGVFFIAMILMATSGAALAVLVPAAAKFNLVVATLTLYMIATSWTTILRKEGEVGGFEFAALLFATSIAAGAVAFGLTAGPPDGRKDYIPPFLFFAFGGIAALAALLDVGVLMRRGVSGAQRIARHLWRMCSALLLAAIAFFIGQGAKIFPQAVRETGVLVLPVLAVLALMIFWLVRVLFTKWYARQPSETGAPR
jgi:hypothetical protein